MRGKFGPKRGLFIARPLCNLAVIIVRTSSSKPRLPTLIMLSALAILPINFFLPSLPGMTTEFDVAYGVMGLSLAAYAGVSA